MNGPDGGPAEPSDAPEPTASVPNPISLTRQAAVPRGAAWRACLATIRMGLLRRPVALLLAFAIFLALPLINGTSWPSAVVQASVGTVIVLALSVGLAWLRVRRWYPAGSIWQGGLGASELRMVFDKNDLTLSATSLRSVRAAGDLLMLTVGPRSLQLAVPHGLFAQHEVEELIARGATSTAEGSNSSDSVDATAPPRLGAGAAAGSSRREVVLTPELAQSIPKTLARLELSRPLSVFLLLFALYQGYRAVTLSDTLSLVIAAMASLSWVALAVAPFRQGRRLYQPGTTVGAGMRDGRLSVRLGEKVTEHDAATIRKVVPVALGVALRLSDGGVLILPRGLLTDDELQELANARQAKRAR